MISREILLWATWRHRVVVFFVVPETRKLKKYGPEVPISRGGTFYGVFEVQHLDPEMFLLTMDSGDSGHDLSTSLHPTKDRKAPSADIDELGS